jgi:transposase
MLKDIAYLPPTEVDHYVFATLVPDDHFLRRVKATVDFERFRALLAAAYSSLGRPAKEPVLMLKLEFLQFHYGLSDREVLRQSQVNIAFRYFLDLSLQSRLPHHTLLTYFRERLGVEKHEQVFQDLIGQARQQGLVQDRLRLKDATHLLANIAIPSTLALVAQTREQLLEAARPYAAGRVTQEEAEAARLHSATADLPDAERLVHRVTHLRALVAWTDTLLQQVAQGTPAQVAQTTPAADAQRLRLQNAVALTHQVLHDRDDPEAGDKVLSAVDAEARTGWHHQYFAGYLLDVSMDADSELITSINVLAANGDEAADATTLIQQEEQAQGNQIEALSIDGIGYRGDLLEEWTDPERLHLEVVVPPTAPTPTGVFPPEAFTLDAAHEELTCPQGQTTRTRERSRHDSGWKYRFRARQCAGCPLRAQCLSNPQTKKGRTVTKNDHETAYRAAQEKAQTARYREVRRQHPRIERKLGELVRWHGARRARYWGRAKTLVQGLLTGWVVNVKRMVKLLGGAGGAAGGRVRADLVGAGANG